MKKVCDGHASHRSGASYLPAMVLCMCVDVCVRIGHTLYSSYVETSIPKLFGGFFHSGSRCAEPGSKNVANYVFSLGLITSKAHLSTARKAIAFARLIEPRLLKSWPLWNGENSTFVCRTAFHIEARHARNFMREPFDTILAAVYGKICEKSTHIHESQDIKYGVGRCSPFSIVGLMHLSFGLVRRALARILRPHGMDSEMYSFL